MAGRFTQRLLLVESTYWQVAAFDQRYASDETFPTHCYLSRNEAVFTKNHPLVHGMHSEL